MKKTLTLILLFCSMVLQAQVTVSETSDNHTLTLVQVLANQRVDKSGKSLVKIVTEETSVQIHNGKDAYKTVQEVEYLISTNGKKITNKRKVLRTITENYCLKGQAEKVFPDMTARLLSGVLSPKTVKLTKEQAPLPFTLLKNSDGICCLRIDKLALMQSDKEKPHIQEMGADLQFVKVTEELGYQSLEPMLYIDSLRQIVSAVSLVSTEKSGAQNQITVNEYIVIKSLTYM